MKHNPFKGYPRYSNLADSPVVLPPHPKLNLGQSINLLLAFLAFFASAPTVDSLAATPADFFETNIRPVLAEHCYKCHSTKTAKFKGGLTLDSRERILTGGDSGPAVVPHKPDQSLLLKAIQHTDRNLEMPPDSKLPDSVIRDFEFWISQGAVLPESPHRSSSDQPAWWDKFPDAALLPPNLPIHEAIDHYVNLRLAKAAVQPADPASDATLIRRLTLDLAGRIPTASEIIAFESSSSPDKKQQLIDRLIKSPGFVRHQVTEFDWWLMGGKTAPFQEYLARSFQSNRSWDQIFKDLLVPTHSTPELKGSEQFLKTRVRDLDRLANDVSVRFFGVNISCAQCHDHPLVPSWKQEHYYGLKSFFSRTFENGDFLGEREYGAISFKTTRGETKQAKLLFLTGSTIPEPEVPEPNDAAKKREKELLEDFKKKKLPLPPPVFSRRAQLVQTALSQNQNGFFARALVNQLWYRLLGHGLVMPIDQMHGLNHPSHPELLLWLARDFASHQFDLQRLVQGFVLSDTYARSSHWSDSDRPAPDLFAVAIPRPLAPHQLAASLHFAAANPDQFQTHPLTSPAFESSIEQLEKSAQSWSHHFERPTDNFQLSVEEALLFSNSEQFEQFLNPSQERLMKKLAELTNRQEQIRLAMLNVLCRAPLPAELLVLDDYLARRADQPVQAIRQVLWALLTSTEFRFNH